MILIVFGVCFYGHADRGESGIASLDIDTISARQFAMGETGTALGDSASVMMNNPAGLGSLSKGEVRFMYYRSFEQSSYFTGTGSYPLPSSYGVAGLSLVYFSTEPFQAIDASGNELGDELSLSDYVLALGYANNPLQYFNRKEDLNLGFNVKMGNSSIYEESESFLAFDFGLLYHLSFGNLWKKTEKDTLSFGVSVLNLGSGVKYINEETPLPRKKKAGLAWQTVVSSKMSLKTALDYSMPDHDYNKLHIGSELTFLKMFFMRVGYKISKSVVDSFSIGGGAKMNFSHYQLNADYAFVPAGDLGTTHAVSLGFIF